MISDKQCGILEGNIFKSVFFYAFPVFLGNLIQVFFNTADIIVLGHMADKIAVASVGATGPVVNLIVNAIVGISAGVSIIIARLVGAKENEKVSKAVDTSIITSVTLGTVIAIIGILLANPLMTLSKCPEECLAGAVLYSKIYYAGIPAITLYNYGATIIRIKGDAKTPLYILIACGILNILLNVILCFVLTQKVIAVAIATTASQLLGAICVTVYLAKDKSVIHFNYKSPKFDFPMFSKIMRYGVPSAFGGCLYSISNIQIQSAINSFGPDLMAGNVATANIEGLVGTINGSFGTATLTFMGQNIGANNKKRVKQSLFCNLIYGFLIVGFVSTVARFFGSQLLNFFIPGETQAIEYGLIRMKYVLSIFFVACFNSILISAMQAFGHTFISMAGSIFWVLLFRVFWMSLIFPNSPTVDTLYLCYTVSWNLNLLFNIITDTIIIRRYNKYGKSQI